MKESELEKGLFVSQDKGQVKELRQEKQEELHDRWGDGQHYVRDFVQVAAGATGREWSLFSPSPGRLDSWRRAQSTPAGRCRFCPIASRGH